MALVFAVSRHDRRHRLDPALHPDLVSRAPGVRHARTDEAERSPGALLVLLHRDAASSTLSSGSAGTACSASSFRSTSRSFWHPHRAGRRHRAFSRADRDHSMGTDDLRLLRELRAGAADASHPRVRASEREADVFSRARRATERRAAVRLGQVYRQARASRRRSVRTRPGQALSAELVGATAIGAAIWWATPFGPGRRRR